MTAEGTKQRPDKASETFCDIMRARAAEKPQEQAFVFLDSKGAPSDQYTFAGLDERARRIATELVAKGLSGERVLLLFAPGLDFVTALFGCFYAGAVAVPIPFLPGKRIIERINSIRRDADSAGVLTLGSLKMEPQIRESLGPDDRLIWIHVDALAPDPQAEFSWPTPAPESLALLQYTSGSTGSPKGVMLSHANLVANCEMIAEAFGMNEATRGVGWLPPFHDMGLIGHILEPVYYGGLSVLMSPLTFLQRPVRWLQAISTWKATISGGPTFAFEICLKLVRDEQLQDLDLSSWDVAYCGSEKVRADILDRFAEHFARRGFRRTSLLPCYGLAETTLYVTGARGRGVLTRFPANRSGQLFPAVNCGPPAGSGSVVVADPVTNAQLSDGAVGEIWVQGPHVGMGYWGYSADNDAIFRASLTDGSGPYLRTGDLGFIEAGQLFVMGRIKDTIISNGVKHCAEDIEAQVMQSHSLFTGLAGAAFAIDSGHQEQAVIIQEVRKTKTEPAELAEAAAQGFASVTREHGLRLFDLMLVPAGSIPRTSNGKIRRSSARDTYLAHGFERLNPPLPNAPIRDALS